MCVRALGTKAASKQEFAVWKVSFQKVALSILISDKTRPNNLQRCSTVGRDWHLKRGGISIGFMGRHLGVLLKDGKVSKLLSFFISSFKYKGSVDKPAMAKATHTANLQCSSPQWSVDLRFFEGCTHRNGKLSKLTSLNEYTRISDRPCWSVDLFTTDCSSARGYFCCESLPTA